MSVPTSVFTHTSVFHQRASRYPGKISHFDPVKAKDGRTGETEQSASKFHHPPALVPRSSDPPSWATWRTPWSLPASAARQNRRWPSSAAALSQQTPSTHRLLSTHCVLPTTRHSVEPSTLPLSFAIHRRRTCILDSMVHTTSEVHRHLPTCP